MSRLTAIFCLGLGLMVTGCESQPASAPPAAPAVDLGTAEAPASSESPTSDKPAAEKPAPEISLEVKSWDETLALVAEHTGKIVVLDLWSTSCDPCLKEFPHLVELHQKHGDKVVCMSASCDYIGLKNMPPESYKPQVLEFLTQQKAAFQNVLVNVESDALFEKIELASIPAVYVFGPDGKLAKRFDNDAGGPEFTYEKNIVPFVEELLKKSGE